MSQTTIIRFRQIRAELTDNTVDPIAAGSKRLPKCADSPPARNAGWRRGTFRISAEKNRCSILCLFCTSFLLWVVSADAAFLASLSIHRRKPPKHLRGTSRIAHVGVLSLEHRPRSVRRRPDLIASASQPAIDGVDCHSAAEACTCGN